MMGKELVMCSAQNFPSAVIKTGSVRYQCSHISVQIKPFFTHKLGSILQEHLQLCQKLPSALPRNVLELPLCQTTLKRSMFVNLTTLELDLLQRIIALKRNSGHV